MDKKLIGLEALLRWENEKYKDIPIIEIIKIMERNKSIIGIGYYIMKKAFEFAKKVNKGRKDKIIISVNISAIQIMDNKFIEKTKSIIEESKVSLDCIGMEITETVILENSEENMEKVRKLKNMGITISLDDFGTGYSSLSYIFKLPLSILKLDKSFISNVNEKKEHVNLVNMITEASHALNLSIVAEGIETTEQFDILNSIGVDHFQGYLFSNPLREDKIVALLN